MDRYKKTSLKMDRNLGYGRNLRAVEINTSRAVARSSRFSMQRCLEDDVEEPENQPKTKIVTLGKQTRKAPINRLEMLQKWKEEKQVRRKQELQNKKPTFRIGLPPQKPIPFSTAGSRIDSQMSFMKDSRKISYNVTNSPRIAKETSLKPLSTSKFQAIPSSSMKLSRNKEPQIPSCNFKPPATQFSHSRIQKESHVQPPNKPKAGLQKPSFVSSKQIKNEEVRQAPIKSQFMPTKPFIAKSKMQPLSKPTALSKPTESKVLKKPEQVQPNISRLAFPNRIAEPKSHQMQNSGRIIKGPSQIAAVTKPTGIPNKSGIKPLQETKIAKKIEEPSKSNDVSFNCEISHIECEPEEACKSFAPKHFSFSFSEEGPAAIYTKLKAGEGRTSTPKRKELREAQEKEAKDKEAQEIQEKEAQQVKEKEAQDIEAQQILEKEMQQIKEAQDKEAQQIQEKEMQQIKEKEAQQIEDKEKQMQEIQEKGAEKYLPEIIEPLLEDDVLCIISKELDFNGSVKAGEIHCGVIKNSPEEKAIEEDSKREDSVTNIPETLSDTIKESHISSFEPASISSEKPPVNLMDLFYSPEVTKHKTIEETENGTDGILENKVNGLENKVSVEKLEDKESVILVEDKKSEEINAFTIAGPSSDSVKQIKATLLGGDAGIITRRRSAARSSNISIRGRRSEMPQLESISESRENSYLKESPPKPTPTKKSTLPKDFTPRRSMRIARKSELDMTEDLFNVRPSLHGTPTKDEPGSSSAYCTNEITYDFDKLDLESFKEQPAIPQRRVSTRKANKVSLLYTPPQKGRVSTVRKSIKGDLMSFSPDV